MEDRAEFGPYLFDRATGILSRDGKPVSVGTRGAALLGALIEADGGPVTKDALMEAGWPGVNVEEGNLSVQIANLRKAMGPRQDGLHWIATVPRVGYRLLKPASDASGAAAATMLPTLAVLPFGNLSGDAEQDYFADGIVEDIITALSRFRSFAVVARSSSFAYKGRAVDVREVARELGVRYVLEGSVRKSAGDTLRISAQLVDGDSGAHLWAESYDGKLDDVFEFQDRITKSVVGVVEPRVRRAEIERARRQPPDSLAAYDLYLRALPDVYAMRPEANLRALDLLKRAIDLDPGFAWAHVLAGQTYLGYHAMQLDGAAPETDPERAISHVRAALATGTDDAAILAVAGFIMVHLGHRMDEGFALLRRAVEENPNNVRTLTCLGVGCLLHGDLKEAEELLNRAIRLNPNELDAHWQLTGVAHVRMAQGRYEEALDLAKRSLAINAGYDATYWMIIAANAHLGRMEPAREAYEMLQGISPGVTLARIRRGQSSRDPHRIDVLIEGMRLAGVPEA